MSTGELTVDLGVAVKDWVLAQWVRVAAQDKVRMAAQDIVCLVRMQSLGEGAGYLRLGTCGRVEASGRRRSMGRGRRGHKAWRQVARLTRGTC